MRFSALVGASICVLLRAGGTAAPQTAGPCDPAGNVRFICGQSSPEDLAIVPGGQWVIASAMGDMGGIRLINVRDGTSTVLFPARSAKVRQDAKIYKTCPGPLDAAGQAAFKGHGLYLHLGKAQVHRLFVVHHGSRESIEVFDVDAGAGAPTLTWVGCAVAPEGPGLNSVVGLADGGFLATNFHPRTGERPPWLQKARAGENTGEVWEWRPSSGWMIVPGSEAPGPNGLEISKDGKWIYIGVWGGQSVTRLSRGQTPAKKDSVVVGFRVDNLRWGPDGSILAAGQGDKTSNVAKVNPDTLQYEEIVRHPDSDVFRSGTAAVQIGNEIWVGSVGTARIARIPMASRPR
jgi:hypothetical protein